VSGLAQLVGPVSSFEAFLLSLGLDFNPSGSRSDKIGMRRTALFLRNWRVFCVCIGLGLVTMASSASARQLSLAPALTSELNRVLNVSEALHRALVEQNEELTEISLREIVLQLGRARAASYLAKPHDRRHLMKILDAAYEQFELSQTSYGNERWARIEAAFNQLANLVRVYKLDPSFGIFFCPKDRTTWVQKGYKPRNPFKSYKHTDASCGIRVSG